MVKPPLRTKSIGFKVSEEEYALLETAAQASGRTLGEWCCKIILASGQEWGIQIRVIGSHPPTRFSEGSVVLRLRFEMLTGNRSYNSDEQMRTDKTPRKRRSVAVLLSGRAQFSPYFGGALVRWTYEVYSRLRDQVEATVFGFPTREKDLYPLRHETSEAWRACAVAAKIPGVRRYEETLWLLALIRRLRQFDVVHIHNRPQWVAALRKMKYEGAIILHLQNDHLGHWSAPALDALAPQLDALVVCSHYLRSTFASKSALLDAKSHVVWNGANLQMFYPPERMREPKTIFFVGQFIPHKGVLQLVQAYERVLDTHPDAKLVIGGATGFGTHKETPYVRQVHEFARSLEKRRNARIHFTGYLDHDKELPSWFQRVTIFSSPSLFQEPFGLVNAEAMACATPVVGSNRGGIPEVLGSPSRVANPENAEEFAATISELLSNPEYCARLGQAGYERCRRLFDWSIISKTWITLLDELGSGISNNSMAHSIGA
jgi:spore coat protein SA